MSAYFNVCSVGKDKNAIFQKKQNCLLCKGCSEKRFGKCKEKRKNLSSLYKKIEAISGMTDECVHLVGCVLYICTYSLKK